MSLFSIALPGPKNAQGKAESYCAVVHLIKEHCSGNDRAALVVTLLDYFESAQAVIEAPTETLRALTAGRLRESFFANRDITRAYSLSTSGKPTGPLDSLSAVTSYCCWQYFVKPGKQLHALFLDEDFTLMADHCLKEGQRGNTDEIVPSIAHLQDECDEKRLIITRLNGTGTAMPTREDLGLAMNITASFAAKQAFLTDYVIWTPDSNFSFRESGLLAA